ncbi:MAG: 30S ribosomal protein S20 [Deltaproteobacteria bacterium]|nr:30S ribosomal protein S20 [Deltaproteobacteria bacterium]MBW1862538.1 30S ribosomal protein S20 [Deltaproteobacteria bacterium]
MAIHKSALKRARQNKVRRLINQSYRTKAKNAIKEVRAAVADNSADQARKSLIKAVSILQKTATKGVAHKKEASRKISRLSRQVNQITSS